MERYKKLVNENYKEPNNGNFDDCTKDILRDLLEDSNSDEDEYGAPFVSKLFILVVPFHCLFR